MSGNSGLVVGRLTVTGPNGVLVHPLDFSIAAGESLAIIGESGSGKTLTARAITGLLPSGVTATGTVTIDGHETVLPASEADWRHVRGARAVLLLQDPFTSLSPVHRCGVQIAQTLTARIGRGELDGVPSARGARAAWLRTEVERRLAEVNLPPRVARQYPGELSGGMRQRVAIAAAIAAAPRLLVADEPTTALDASTQGEVLDLLRELQRSYDMSLLLISHDLGVVRGRADRVAVMRAGEVVESGSAGEVLGDPRHPYTRALIDANPSVTDLRTEVQASSAAVLLATEGISKSFGSVRALSPVDITIATGEVVAIVGESGSGKSTLARCIAGLDKPSTGHVTLDGVRLSPGRTGRSPGQMQIVFQDPYSTLNPILTVRQTLAEALRVAGRGAGDVDELLATVDLSADFAGRRPSQLSGGQRQRIAIARALAPRPRLLICDESVSALDVSVQAQILTLLERLRDDLGLSILFITHDLGVVARIASRVYVLHGGEVIESGATGAILDRPEHPYTAMLVAAARHDSIDGRQVPAPQATAPQATGESLA